MEMKRILTVLLTMVVLALVLVACAPAGREVPLQLTYDDFAAHQQLTRSLEVNTRDTVKITLPSNPTTGFRWELAGISDPAVLQQVGDSEYVLPDSQAIGAGGQEIWTFKVQKRGTSTVSLAYSQPWDGGTKGGWTIDVEVKVK
jgi:inhibitor of cysteine peptidase